MTVPGPGAWLAVAAGAALGAWARWGLALALNRAGQPLPWGTLVANVVGGLAIGAALAAFERRPELADAWRPFVVTGFLGAMTTFSTFSAESLAMLQRGAVGPALAHSALHLAGSLGAAAIGWRLLR
ncbi:MAG TPA: fluoride efflux transporter CrcB [Baekduia sp.]|nr:fluoride efflux transporter CrcB [Baekduia sp.]